MIVYSSMKAGRVLYLTDKQTICIVWQIDLRHQKSISKKDSLYSFCLHDLLSQKMILIKTMKIHFLKRTYRKLCLDKRDMLLSLEQKIAVNSSLRSAKMIGTLYVYFKDSK